MSGRLLRKARETILELGWLNGGLCLIERALSRCGTTVSIGKYYLVAQPVAAGRLVPERRGQAFSILTLEGDHPLLHDLNRPPDEIARRLAGGAVCFLALREGRVIGHLWVTRSPYLEPHHRTCFVPYPANSVAWDFDMVIVPEERLGIAFARLWDHANEFLRASGAAWTCSRVSAFNSASLRAHTRLGMRVLHSIYYFGVGSVQVMVGDARPFLSISLARRSAPEVIVSPAGLA